jgi:hypothetical protein
MYHKWKENEDAVVSEYDIWYSGGWFQHIMGAFNCSEMLQVGFPAYVHKWPVPRKLKPTTFTTTFCCCWSPSCANKIYCELMNTCLINQARSVLFSMWMCLSPWSMDAMPTDAYSAVWFPHAYRLSQANMFVIEMVLLFLCELIFMAGWKPQTKRY